MRGSLVFSDQNDVDNFVDNYGKDGEKLKEVIHCRVPNSKEFINQKKNIFIFIFKGL